MPYKDPEKRKKYTQSIKFKNIQKEYYQRIKERRKKYNQRSEVKKRLKENRKKWVNNNPNYRKKWYEENKERIKVKNKENYLKIKKVKKKWYEENKIKISKNRKEYRDKNKEKLKLKRIQKKIKVYNYYSNYDIKCNCCGEGQLEFLSIDHINNDGATYRGKRGTKGGSSILNWIIKNDFPPGFQILCMNCNFAKGKNEDHLCPHQIKKAEQILN